ncbi:MAG: YggS family pyridoxal phosphate-dependent enzyme [Chloroflexi bacterium]|nr:YggS family pyridoxal phosphate-dependent enzyme [Chloroflexota bacterium]
MNPISSNTDIGGRVKSVLAEIAAACERAHRSPDAVTLVAVSKTHSADQVVEAIRAGVRHLGENRLEEALPKMAAVSQLDAPPANWHMIGTVQSRKARQVLDGFSLLHSLDDVKLAERLSRFLVEQDRSLEVLMEINISGEMSKHGWQAYGWQHELLVRQALWDDVAHLLALPGLRVRGLMTMAPIVDDPEQARPVFKALCELRAALANDFPAASWSELSMGMTDDYPVAVEEGATLVRVGRAIFGVRF